MSLKILIKSIVFYEDVVVRMVDLKFYEESPVLKSL